MKPNIATFVPFQHDNLQHVRELIDSARAKSKSEMTDIFTSALIYVNVVDYVSVHLLNNLSNIAYLISHYECKSQLCRKPIICKGKPLGIITDRLNEYNFPDKEDFIKELKDFNELRKPIIHDLAKSDDVKKLSKELVGLHDLAESIITRYDSISIAVSDIYTIYVANIGARQNKVKSYSDQGADNKSKTRF